MVRTTAWSGNIGSSPIHPQNYCSLSSARSEQLPHKEKVIGSNPVWSTFTALTQLVECHFYIVEVVSSSLTSCTKRVFKNPGKGYPIKCTLTLPPMERKLTR